MQTNIFACHVSCSAMFLLRRCGLARGTHEMPPPSLKLWCVFAHAGSQQPPSGAEEAPRRIASGSRMRERPNSMTDTSMAPQIYTRGRSRCSESTCAHPTASSWLTAKKHRGRAGGPLPASCSSITSADRLVERRIQETHAVHARDG